MAELYAQAGNFALGVAVFVFVGGVVGLLIIALSPKPKGWNRD